MTDMARFTEWTITKWETPSNSIQIWEDLRDRLSTLENIALLTAKISQLWTLTSRVWAEKSIAQMISWGPKVSTPFLKVTYNCTCHENVMTASIPVWQTKNQFWTRTTSRTNQPRLSNIHKHWLGVWFNCFPQLTEILPCYAPKISHHFDSKGEITTLALAIFAPRGKILQLYFFAESIPQCT